MKKIIRFFALSFVLPFAFGACVEDFKIGDKFLEKAPGVDVTADTIFGKADYARRFLWNCYQNFITDCLGLGIR